MKITVTMELNGQKYIFEDDNIERVKRYMDWIYTDQKHPHVSENSDNISVIKEELKHF